MVNPAFKQGLREGLTGGYVFNLLNRKRRSGGLTKQAYSGLQESFGVPAPEDENRPPISIEQLNVYALERWEVSERTCLPEFHSVRSVSYDITDELSSSFRRSFISWLPQGVTKPLPGPQKGCYTSSRRAD